MEFRDLKSQYNEYKDKFDTAILEAVAGTHFIGGSQVGELESVLAKYVGRKHCITCANGTDALQLALMAWEIGPGDAVFVPDFTFFSSGEVVSCVGATPIFVDVCEDTFNISPDSLREAIAHVKKNTELTPRVIVAVDLFGLPANMEEIQKIADENKLLILEDAAQGFGGVIKSYADSKSSGADRKACSFGDISTTSFFPAKPLGCYGDGGAIFTDDDEWAGLLKSYKVHGKGASKYDNVRIGMNSRLDTVQAAVLLTKMEFFDEELDRCENVAKMYDEAFADAKKLRIPVIPERYRSSWAQYTILLENAEDRDRVIGALKEKNIPAMVYYQKPMHEQEAFAYCTDKQVGASIGADPCPVTTDICGRVVSLPFSAYVSRDDIELILSTIYAAI